MNNIIVLSGGFDPLHAGHIAMFEEASQHGDIVVLLNSDEWLARKKGRAFLKYEDREAVIKSLRHVIDVIRVDDSDDTVVKGLELVAFHYSPQHITFANGGDRYSEDTPETDFCVANDISLAFEVGGYKTQSSSQILEAWATNETIRVWGHWSVLKEYDNVKVKELTVKPGKHLSMQRHKDRNELWLVVEGTGLVKPDNKTLHLWSVYVVPENNWHQLINNSDADLRIVEIQWGKRVVEEDIERL